jgi:autotransporter-associated beta strand protein
VDKAGGSIQVGNWLGGNNNGVKATLDLSGLTNFTVIPGLTTIQVGIGDNVGSRSNSLILAATNTITVTNLNIGPTSLGAIHSVRLGSGTNILNVNTLNMGTGSRDSGTITFRSETGSVRLRNTAGDGRANLNMGLISANQGTGYGGFDNFDVTGHHADLLIGTFNMGNYGRAGACNRYFAFNQGLLDIETITMAQSKGSGVNNSTITFGGGTVLLGNGGIGSINLASNGAGALVITNGIVTTSVDFTKAEAFTGNNTATLTLNGGTLEMQNHNLGGAIPIDVINLLAGTLKDVAQINSGSNVVKSGAGTLTLAGTNTYTGNTLVDAGTLTVEGVVSNSAAFTVNGGILLVNGQIGNGSNTIVASSGTLGGSGVINASSSSVSPGAILSPGVSIGTLTISNSVVLNNGSITHMEINSTNFPTADKLNAGSVVLGGTLVVTNLGDTNLTLGATFDLFDGGLVGQFSLNELPALPQGLAWDTSQLQAGGDGTIKVVLGPPPGIATQPLSQTNRLGSNVAFTVTATNAMGYQWYFGGTALNGATATNLSLTNIKLNDAGQYRVVVSNLTASVTSAPANLVVLFDAPTPVLIPGGGSVSFTIQAETNRAYWLEAKTDLAVAGWAYIVGVTNTNGVVQLQDLLATNLYKCYRVGSTNYP